MLRHANPEDQDAYNDDRPMSPNNFDDRSKPNPEVQDAYNDDRPMSPNNFEDRSKHVPWYHRVMLNKPLKVVIVMMLASLLAPVLVFLFLYEDIYIRAIYNDGYSTGICSHSRDHRVPCSVRDKVPVNNCSVNCCYDEENDFCFHYVPSRFSYLSKTKWDESKILTPRLKNIPYGSSPNLKSVKLHFHEVSVKHLKFTVYDTTKVDMTDTGDIISANKSYYYKIFYPEIFVEVYSNERNLSKPLLSTSRGPLVAGDNLWEWNYYIADENLYGVGNLMLKPKLVYSAEGNGHSYPFLMSQRNGSFHGVYLEQDGPINFNMTESKVVGVKSYAGNQIGVNFFFGPTPAEVTDQFVKHVGVPDIPPYWALGVHFCRGNMTSSQNMTRVMEEFDQFTADAELREIPYETDCIADGIFDFLNFDMAAEDLEIITSAVNDLKKKTKKFMPTLRPHIKFDNGSIYQAALQAQILILEPGRTNSTYLNAAYNSTVAFPDYSMEETISWMKTFWPFSDMTDSFVLADNWPRVDNGTANCFVNLPYVNDDTNATMCDTVPWNARNPASLELHMNQHNLYGVNHANAVRSVTQIPNLNGVNNLILSASSFPGIKTGIHFQNVSLTWSSFKQTFIDAVWSSIQGNHVGSVPVCGDTDESVDTEAEHLCIKWYLASVFLPVFRVSSKARDNHPLAFSGYANKIMMNAINMRYKLLPYFYSLLASGEPLIRPLFYDFPDCNDTYIIDEQFTVGGAIILAPNFRAQQSSVSVYIPNNETVYDLWGGNQLVGTNRENPRVDIPTLENEIVILLRAGYIIPIQEKIYQTANEMRIKSNYTLIVGLNCTDTDNITVCESNGSLVLSNTTYWTFTANETSVEIDPNIISSRPSLCRKTADGFNEVSSSIIGRIKIYGLNTTVENNMGEYHLLDNVGFDACVLNDGETFSVNIE